MKNICKVIVGCAALAGFAFPASAQITLSLSPASQTIGVGGLETYNLNISGLKGSADYNGPALGAFTVTLDYNSTIASLQSDTFGNLSGLDLLNTSGSSFTSDSSTAGVIQLTEYSLDSAATLESSQTASFTLATFTLEGVSAGTTPLTFDVSNTSLSDENGSSLDLINANGGSLTVTSVPEPGACALGALALGMFGVRRIRSRFTRTNG
jgi:hypothetical protein